MSIANLGAFATGFSLNFAVVDLRTALVIGDFHVCIFAIEASPRALLVYAVVNGSDTHVVIECNVLPVEAFQTFSVTIVVVAIRDCHYTGAITR